MRPFRSAALAALLVLAATISLPGVGVADARAGAPPALALPAPTGRSPVGTFPLWWVDPSRLDPFAEGRERRQLIRSGTPVSGPERFDPLPAICLSGWRVCSRGARRRFGAC